MNETELLQEFHKLANAAQLQVQCLGSGNPYSQIAIVSEAPSEREVAMKMPQVGSGGRFLWEVLRKHDLKRSDVWTTNVVKRQLLNVDDEKTSVSRNELDHWHHLLRWELSQLPNLKYILVLGNLALQFFTGDTGITKWRGSVLDWESKKLVIAYNPALIIREPKWDIVFRFDANKLNKVVTGTWKPHEINAHINPSPTEAIKWIDRMEDEKLPVAYDTETGGGETQCVGLANDPHSGMCINFRTDHDHHYSAYEERFVWRRLARFFANPTIKRVAQNASFDMAQLWHTDGVRVHDTWFDTMLGHHTLYPSLPHSLAFITSQYTSVPYYKDEGKVWSEGGSIDTRWTYNIKDCCVTIAGQRRILEELRTQKLEKFFFDHVMRLQPHLIDMTMVGVASDQALKQSVVSELQEETAIRLEAFYAAVQSATGDGEYRPNPKSPKQIGELLFRRLRLAGRGVKTDEENRKRMRDHPRTSSQSIKVIDTLNAFVEDNKFATTYAEMVLDPDNRFRCKWKQMGTTKAPGRLSSSQTDWGTGGNMQNIPERAKPMFIADQGRRFVYFDLAQAEARVVAWEANIPSWKEQFERARLEGGYDAHRALASDLFGIPYNETPKEDWTADRKPTLRYIAKRCRHGLNYRMGPDRLAITIQKDTEHFTNRDALDAYHKYHRVTPELKRWWDTLVTEVKDTGQLWSSMGRRWILLERLDDDALESIVAFKPQSAIGDKVTSVIYLAQSDPGWRKEWFVHLDLHDALIWSVPDTDNDAIESSRIMKKYAEAPLIIHGQPLIIPADFAWSVPDNDNVHRWSGLKKIKDPAIIERLKAA